MKEQIYIFKKDLMTAGFFPQRSKRALRKQANNDSSESEPFQGTAWTWRSTKRASISRWAASHLSPLVGVKRGQMWTLASARAAQDNTRSDIEAAGGSFPLSPLGLDPSRTTHGEPPARGRTDGVFMCVCS